MSALNEIAPRMLALKFLKSPEPALSSLLQQYSGRHVHFFPKSGNAGDGLIAYATYELFKAFDIHFTTHHQTDVVSGQTVIIGGGGNLIEGLYPDVAGIIGRHSKRNNVVLLPHTIVGHGAILRETNNDLIVFCRERISYNNAIANGADEVNTHLCQDMAFYLSDDHFDTFRCRGSGTLKAFRTDKESAQDIEVPADNIDISLSWNGDLWTSPRFTEYATKSMAAFIAQYETVLTDRLHVSILASFLGKQVFLLPNSYYKNFAVYDQSMQGRFPHTRFVDTLEARKAYSFHGLHFEDPIAEEIVVADVRGLPHKCDQNPHATTLWRKLFEKLPFTNSVYSSDRLIVLVASKGFTSGHTPRVVCLSEAAKRLGYTTLVIEPSMVGTKRSFLSTSEAIFICGVPWDDDMDQLYAISKASNVPVVFDLNDMVIRSNNSLIIDEKYFPGSQRNEKTQGLVRLRACLDKATCGLATTNEVANHVRECDLPTFVFPPGFDAEMFKTARLSHRIRIASGGDGLVRLGFLSAFGLNQRDFGQASSAVAQTLSDNAHCRLVLFYQDGLIPRIDCPELSLTSGQIEWRPMLYLEDLNSEIARLDINLAPVDNRNEYGKARSQLAFLQAALCGVLTVASATNQSSYAILDGENGFLAKSHQEWRLALTKLVGNKRLRDQLGSRAYISAIADYGPLRTAEMLHAVLINTTAPNEGVKEVVKQVVRRSPPKPPPICAHTIEWQSDNLKSAEVTVIIPCYNYAHYLEEALQSVYNQTLKTLDIIVVDDASTDDSFSKCRNWLKQHSNRFNRSVLIRNVKNSGLSMSRNVAFYGTETPYCLPLDADNRLLPNCCKILLKEIRNTNASFAYPKIRDFGDTQSLRSHLPYNALRLAHGNYIDAMALIATEAWADVGGYAEIPYGWEDYDFWCLLAERGRYGRAVPEILAEYRVHKKSMLHTDTSQNIVQIVDLLHQRHPWLSICPWEESVDLDVKAATSELS